MCGIVAVVSKLGNGFNKKQEDVFYQMLYADVLRGDDSTGVIAVENTTAFHTAKEAIEATWFIPQIKGKEIGTTMYSRGKAFIGHNRKATVGLISDQTAHPFVIDETFAMVHNGTLSNHKALANTDVDSEALAKVLKEALDAEEWKEKLEETLGKVWGAYAIGAYDQNTNKVHFLRNKERPLAYIETSDSWIFASEGYMIGWIASRNGYDLSKTPIKMVGEHELISIDLDKNELSVEKLEPKKAIPSTRKNTTHTTGAGEKMTSRNISKDNSTFEGGDVLSKNEFKRLKKKYLYTRQEFWALDYVEKHFPRTIEDGEKDILVIGESDDLNYECSMNAEVNLDELGIPIGEIMKYFEEHRWVGLVHDMSYDKKSGNITFHLSKAKPIGQSKAERFQQKDIHEAPTTVQ